MKTTIEVKGYTILIEEMEGTVQVSALLDEEVVEEFTLEAASGESDDDSDKEEGSEIKGFEDFSEEEDFEGEMQDEDEMQDEMQDEDDEDEDDEDEDEDEESALESFQSFINKSKMMKSKRRK